MEPIDKNSTGATTHSAGLATSDVKEISADELPLRETSHDVDLSAADILGAVDTQIERFYVPEWEGHVYLKTMTGTGRDAFEIMLLTEDNQNDHSNIRAKFLVNVLCDKEGTLLFTPAHIDALGAKSAAGLTRVYNRASEINRLSKKDVDQLAGNSGRAASGTL